MDYNDDLNLFDLFFVWFRYHYREAVVVSALQVEKHPLTTPGPYSSPLQAARHVISQIAPSVPGSPGRFSFSSAFRNLSPRRTPHSSPKMKLRFFKKIFFSFYFIAFSTCLVIACHGSYCSMLNHFGKKPNLYVLSFNFIILRAIFIILCFLFIEEFTALSASCGRLKSVSICVGLYFFKSYRNCMEDFSRISLFPVGS